jgi:hypothetical protein
MRRLSAALILVGAVSLAAPAASFAQQSVVFSIGGFVPKGFDSRDRNDQILDDSSYLAFRMSDFNGVTVGGEYLVGLGRWFDAGLGVNWYGRTVPSVYADVINSDGSEIEQQLRLRMVPFTATFRLLPLGRSSGFQPYIGGGVAIINWKYTETGDFVDFSDGSIFSARYEGSGTATGPLVLFGATVPVGAVGIGGEIRYQHADGDLPADQFLLPKIDLGGWSYMATVHVRF